MVQTHPEVEPFFPEVLQYRTVNYLIIRTCLLQIQPCTLCIHHAYILHKQIEYCKRVLFCPIDIAGGTGGRSL